MESDEVIVSKEMLKSIGGETRINILKALKSRQKTQSELAQELKLSPATILEHMANLEKAGLIEPNPEYNERKWKYYRLTKTARPMVEGRKISIMILLTSGSAILTAGLFILSIMSSRSLGSAQPTNASTGGTEMSQTVSQSLHASLFGIAAVAMLGITVILIVYYLLKKKEKN